jgi:diguanylate cyclase (GGDEF)-like protein
MSSPGRTLSSNRSLQWSQDSLGKDLDRMIAQADGSELRGELLGYLSKLQYQALHDSLTGLPNRAFFRERLEQVLQASQRDLKPSSVLLFDLDGFKQVNDQFGHQVGDRLLEQVAARIRGVLRKADMIARVGGDEFAVVPWGAVDSSRATLVAEKILQSLETPIVIDGHSIEARASIGIAAYPQHGDDAGSILRAADIAMYAAKHAKTGYSIFTNDRDEIHNGMPSPGQPGQPIDQFELLLHYQPIVDLKGGQATRVEALARWGHPKHGLLPPDDFIPAAEESALIKPLTAWALNEALGQIHSWNQAGIDLGVAVNLSARSLLEGELPDLVAGLLTTWRVSPEKLTLEITERSLLLAETDETLRRVHALGVRLSVDDFGTGYSSLAYLKRLPVHEIKIDGSFVSDMVANRDDATIVKSTIDLGHNLGLTVVAEAVENAETAALLAHFGCDQMQGFQVCRPVPAATLGPWLRARRRLLIQSA